MKKLALFVFLACAVAAAQTAPKSAFFTTSDHVRIHYLETGKGPALVFIPGWTMPADIWEHQIAHFAKSYHVIAIDPRSQGDSDKPSDGNYPERRAQDYYELLQSLKLPPAVLVGWSLAVLELLSYYEEFGPSTVRGLVLVDGFIYDKLDPQMGRGLAQWMHGLQRGRQKSTESFVRGMYKKPQTEEYLHRITKASLATPTNTAALLIRNIDREDWSPVLARIAANKAPVLGLFTPQLKPTVDLLKSKVPAAQIVVFEDSGHAIFVDEPQKFNRILDQFLSSLK